MLNAVKKNYKAVLVLLALLAMVFSSFDFPGNTKAAHDEARHLVDIDATIPCKLPDRCPICLWGPGFAE